ncbi:GDSL-like Lipase/Acylhydrolase family protein [Fibrobacter sp. UWCM]|uniref:GDSL-type esterase/lipase family protein n=1 Tax=unclassified Fibrobacter TaxID=2634177 RepID=UPI0009100BA6|nr:MULTISPECIES: GDSL-type esterase/lipase family protein [unclassified Fibrobacter]SHG54406.1 GDSL-like Lipase/Acylhydrolase family protein [Fibrobacter sp. UWCM]SOE56702.1 GDSL-like Lipase/Acylhydrolase family protein [Fibrobacter sp. UWT3]
MKGLSRILGILTFAISATALFAAPPVSTPAGYIVDFTKYDFIDSTLNIIQFPSGKESFEPFFQKMDSLVFENKGKVNILHIGGSHIQADVISGRIREHLVKEYPGASAGRGFVFPYSAARTNTPSSYGSQYKGIWDMSKNVLREVKKPLGLLGIAVSTSDPRAEFTLLLDKYNSAPVYAETKFRLFGYSDSNNVVPVLVVDSVDIKGVRDSATQSYVFKSPRPIDTLHFAFRWSDTALQAKVAQYLVDSLVQDSIYRASLDTLNADSTADSTAKKNALPENQEASADSMFQGNCDILDTTCLEKEEPKNDLLAACRVFLDSARQADSTAARDTAARDSSLAGDSTRTADSTVIADTLQKAICDSLVALSETLSFTRPRFTMTGVISESDYPGIVYTNVGINGARIAHYFEETCPLFEKELAFLKPDLVIFAIGINDANVEKFDDKTFRNNYDILIERIRRVNPNAAFIFETNNDMYRKVRKRRYVQHPVGEQARKAFFLLAEKHKAGVWDKFSLMGGLGSMAKWEKASLAKKDKIHFNMAGYHLLGDMFYKALIDAYQEHIANLPALEPTPKKEEEKKKK